MKNFVFGVCVVTTLFVGVSLLTTDDTIPSTSSQAYTNCITSREVAFTVAMKKDQNPNLKSLSNEQIAHVLCKDADPSVWIK